MRTGSLAVQAAQASLASERPSVLPPPARNMPVGGSGDPRPDASSQLLIWAERCAAGAALITLSPALAGVMLAVRYCSGASPLVAHRRAGLDGEPFWLLKIRTMWARRQARATVKSRSAQTWIEYLENAELPVIKKGPDPRVTSSFAAFCRRFSIDELPQLIHVVSRQDALSGTASAHSARNGNLLWRRRSGGAFRSAGDHGAVAGHGPQPAQLCAAPASGQVLGAEVQPEVVLVRAAQNAVVRAARPRRLVTLSLVAQRDHNLRRSGDPAFLQLDRNRVPEGDLGHDHIQLIDARELRR